MKILSGLVALTMAFAAFAGPAAARDAYVQDGAGLFSAATVSSLNTTIGDFYRQTGKEVVVVTQPSLDGTPVQDAAEKVFAQQQVNGVLVFLSKAEKKQGIVPDRAAAKFFPPGEIGTIRDAMRGYFRSGDFDTGITTGVNLILDQYRSHERALTGAGTRRSYAPTTSTSSFGGGMSLFWLILILLAGFLIIRAVFRAISRPRMMPPGYGGPGPGMPGYGGPGYGAGYGAGGMGYGGGGGGSFFSGLLGGLGGAFIGNEMFGRNNGGNFGDATGAGIVGGGDQSYQDASGFQSDAGQADMGNASFGDYGSAGGGFDGGGGGFDSGGGGGGRDSGGGGW